MTYAEFKKNYKWIIKQAPEVTALYGIDDKAITMTKTTYIKDGSRWIKTETETTDITPEFYLNGVDAVPFFRGLGGFEKLVKSYTKYGFIPVESISISPDKSTKIVRTYSF